MTLAIEVSAQSIFKSYLDQFAALMADLDLEAVERLVGRLRRARDEGATIFIAGNGGSASTASHWVNDLGKATKKFGNRPIRVHSLVDNVSWLSALGNDEGFDRVFAGQLENFATPGDVLLLISASGNSPNLLRAADLAAERGVDVIALLGFDGGALKDMVTDSVWLETAAGEYGLVETGHSLIADLVTTCLMHDAVPAAVDGNG